MSDKEQEGAAPAVDAEVVDDQAPAPWDMAEEPSEDLVAMGESGLAALNSSEINAQVALAKRFPRSAVNFMRKAIALATQTRAIAESCIYALPRAGKPIKGPSIRLAEIVASTYQNLHAATRVLEPGSMSITAQGVAWDLENNVRITTEVQRRITNKSGGRYNDDMVLMTGNAAASIALRNAIFRVVPRAYIDQIYDRVLLTAIGKASTFVQRRDEILSRLAKMGATIERVLPVLAIKEVGEITAEHLEVLIGAGTAMRNGDKSVDEMFPAVAPQTSGGTAPAGQQPAQEGRRVSTRGARSGQASGSQQGAPPPGGSAPPTPPPGATLPTREALAELGSLRFAVQIEEEDVCKWFGKTAFAQFTAAEVSEALVRLTHVDNGGKLNSKGEIIPNADAKSEAKPEEKPTPAADKPAGDQPTFRGGKTS